MAGHVKSQISAPRRKLRRSTDEPAWVRWGLTGLAMAFAVVFLFLPLANVFAQALSRGWQYYQQSIAHPHTLAAIKLTLLIAAICVPLNCLFGLAAAWAIAKFEFRGKSILTALIDLPFSVSPVVSGLMIVVLFGAQGVLGEWLRERGIHIVFSVSGMALATLFVTFPFVARELIPVMQASGSDQEQAALTLGASGWRTFWHVTLPSVKWGLLYGIILCNARAMGEFGAVSVVSSHIAGLTDTLPLRVEKLYNEYNAAGAFAVASLLAMLALVTLVIKTWLEWRVAREEWLAQQAPEAGAPSENGNSGNA
ncbi:sulfate ABC transporter permease subunit CysW [Fontisphaera persica]|uniref:sulfate ABC transporter permease subunit CysW n=1 Tax=Fontisphaera persica TaxID=2974023 RepID=UPI0024C0CC8F|nr:sulfate ABC transporter permease subunit CysW [Fontisphaera persica]WCJ60167.1 sulfate ABC transporter permease subunit CysW [Fontisphaera persica]